MEAAYAPYHDRRVPPQHTYLNAVRAGGTACGAASLAALSLPPPSTVGRALAWTFEGSAASLSWCGLHVGLPGPRAVVVCPECDVQGTQACMAAAVLLGALAFVVPNWSSGRKGTCASGLAAVTGLYAMCHYDPDPFEGSLAGPGLLLACAFVCAHAWAAWSTPRREHYPPATVDAKFIVAPSRPVQPLVRAPLLSRAPLTLPPAAMRVPTSSPGRVAGVAGQHRLPRPGSRTTPLMSISGANGNSMSVGVLPVGGLNAASTMQAPLPAPVNPTRPIPPDALSSSEPLHVVVAGAGVGGLALANALVGHPNIKLTVLETTSEFRRFGGPIQLASNAMEVLRSIDADMYAKVEAAATFTGDKVNGIKDGLRDEWYAKFDLGTPARVRGMQYTCVVERPDLQTILLERVTDSVRNRAKVLGYTQDSAGVHVELEDGSKVHADVLVGADGIWSAVRASMRDEPVKGEGSGVSFSGYTVFAGELAYESPDNGEVGYKVYIGPGQYFVITDIGKGNYQWYAFLARPPRSAETEPKPNGNIPYLRDLFEGWSPEIHDILNATKEEEAAQRDLYDRPPSVLKDWNDGSATLMGDAVHAMMPNLGQGGCQAIEDAKIIAEELLRLENRSGVPAALVEYRNRRLLRSATVQGLSRFASDIIIKGFDTPAKISIDKDGGIKVENFNYAGVVTRVLQPFMPIFFSIQFNFLYSGWRNEPFALEPIRDLLVIGPGVIAGGLVADSLLGGAGGEAVSAALGGAEGTDEAAGLIDTIAQVASQLMDSLGSGLGL